VVVHPLQARELLIAVTCVRAEAQGLREPFGAAPDGWLFCTRSGSPCTSDSHPLVWREARELTFTPEPVESPLAGRPYDLRQAKCIDGQREIVNQRLQKALEEQ